MSSIDTNADQAAKETAEVAIQQAREVSKQVIEAVSCLEPIRMIYLGAMGTVVLATLIFNMASFTVGVDYAVSESTAQAQRIAESKLNSWSYSAFTSSMWGKLMWVAAIVGIALVIYEAVTKRSAAWLPLGQIGTAAAATLMLTLLFFVGFPDLSAYSDADSSATLLGFWLPFAAAVTATAASVKRLA